MGDCHDLVLGINEVGSPVPVKEIFADILTPMDHRFFSLIAEELAEELPGHLMGRTYQSGRYEFFFDLRLSDSRYLYITIEPSDPRIYLVRRRLREIERSATAASPFVSLLKKHMANARIRSVEKLQGERALIVRCDRTAGDGADALAVQLTGRSANLFLLRENIIIASARDSEQTGQNVGDIYQVPARPRDLVEPEGMTIPGLDISGSGKSVSEYLDSLYKQKAEEKRLETLAAAARSNVKNEIKRNTRLIANLKNDLQQHGEPERWKKFGDLLLANIAAPERVGNKIRVTDLFDESFPTIEIEVDEHESPAEAAQQYFRRYTKSRNAQSALRSRIEAAETEIAKLEAKAIGIETAVRERDLGALEKFSGRKQPLALRAKKKAKKEPDISAFARSFMSSDGFEILVGKKAKDNDYLTFRIARSLETWLHAADYPGSHVVIRESGKKDVPNQTLIEAAQLAGFYSQAKSHPKAAVHYTQKKFVNKPRGAAPGLVSLSRFKTLLVEPGVPPGVKKIIPP